MHQLQHIKRRAATYLQREEGGTMHLESGTAPYFRSGSFLWWAASSTLAFGMPPLEDLIVPLRGDNTPSHNNITINIIKYVIINITDNNSEGDIITGGRHHDFRGRSIRTEGDMMIS